MQQQELQLHVVELLKLATTESDLARRLQVLHQTEDLLLRADTQAETVGTYLDYFLNLQADPHVSLRRYAAHFLDKCLLFKPSLALRGVSAITVLINDTDATVRELALKAAVKMHGRALFLLALEVEDAAFKHHQQCLHEMEVAVRALLESGCPDHPIHFHLATRWAKAFILAQTPSPLPTRIRVPSELRGVSCLQDLPDKTTRWLDPNMLRDKAQDLLRMLISLLQKPPNGSWSRMHLSSLLRCSSAVARQRPLLLGAVIEAWSQLLGEAARAAATAAPAAKAAAASPPKPSGGNHVDLAETKQLLDSEIQYLLTSSLTVEHHVKLVELLRLVGVAGPLEDLTTQAKYQQICEAMEQYAAELNGEPKAKRARKTKAKRVWAMSEGIAVLEDDGAFDADALLSGEAEVTCRHFEDYFGLPSQREPAGHVSGPALLASRMVNSVDMARLALNSLNSLPQKRSLHRDRASERIVAFSEPPVRDPQSRVKVNGAGMPESLDLSVFLSEADATSIVRDPRNSLLSSAYLPGMLPLQRSGVLASKDAQIGRGGGNHHPTAGLAAAVPLDAPRRDLLQLRIFSEVLEAQRRMDKSLMCVSFSEGQVASFDRVCRQVAIHMAMSTKVVASPMLQRKMCEAFMVNAFDALKRSLDSKTGSTAESGAALGKLVELFYAKFVTDIARWQEASDRTGKTLGAAATAAKTPLNEILEGVHKSRAVFTYAELFQLFVDEFTRRDIPRRELRTFLNEIPVVPLSAFTMLEKQCQQLVSRKMALLTVLSLIENKPSCRWHGLHLLFRLAYSGCEDKDVRFDTIRLIINKIYSNGPHAPMRWQLPHLNDEEAAPLLGAAATTEDETSGWEIPDEDYVDLQKLRGRCVEDVATLMLRSIAPVSAKYAFPMNVPLRVEQLRGELFKTAICSPKDRVWLYLALCIKRPVLLHELVETFTKCDVEMKEHLINSIEEAIKHIPASEPELLTLVEKAVPETERLVLKVLNILMQTSQGKEALAPAYGKAVTDLYGITKNPELLVPVFDLLERQNLLDFLPAVLELGADKVTDAFRQLIRSRAPPLSITELLTELHHMNSPGEDIVPVQCSMQALNILFGMRDQFDPKVYGIVIQALVEEPGRMPTLFMRTIIQVVKDLPRLSDFVVMEILPRLVRQEVWGDETLWRGFMIVLQHTFASQPGGAARVLAMLPMSQLEDVLVTHPDWKAQLREFIARQPAGATPPHVRQLLQ
mmetsp:Transcript_125854/g.245532  ORF Transcript_125854/g.245532 Transcript_125854/m.245532 type:complete len:1228 (+) Transcript_125854:99-3782(+)